MPRINPEKIGIDLGTTFCCCGIFKAHRVEIISYNDSKRIFPSHVYYNPKSSEIVAGSSARFTPKSINHSVFDSKRFIGRTYDDPVLREDMKNWPFKVLEGPNNSPVVEMDYNNGKIHLTANDISTEILKAIKLKADESSGNDSNAITEAVITVPAYFNQKQREETKKAAQAANIKVIQIINEPTAAAIAYAYQRMEEDRRISGERTLLIYDFGGGTFDVSIIRLNYARKTVVVLATGGDSHLGGNDVDMNIVNFYISKYCTATGTSRSDIEPKKLVKLRKAVEASKCLLSAEGCNDCEIECEWIETQVKDVKFTISLLDKLNKELFMRTMTIVDDVLSDANLSPEDITDVVLVGGSSRIKKVQELLCNKFSNICRNVDPDEIVAYGATISANMSQYNFTVTDVISHTLSTDLEDDKIYEMLHKNTEIPCSKTQRFANYEDDQKYIDVTIYEGDGDKISEVSNKSIRRINNKVTKLGYFKFDLQIPNKAKEVIVTLKYDVDRNGMLNVTAEEERDGKTKSLSISLKH